MPIDQTGLNNLLAMVYPKNSLTALREHRDGLQKKLEQAANSQHDSNNSNTDIKQVIVDLKSADKQLQQAVYEDETRKLEIERVKREEASAKNLRERERMLARHERVLSNASMSKLLSAITNTAQCQTMAGLGMSLTFSSSPADTNNSGYPQYSLMGKVEEIQRDLKESADFGIAAAEVARRRKDNQLKADIELAAYKKAKKEKIKKKLVNITI